MSYYFDYNATAPAREAVIDAMTAVMRGAFGNPSSMHAAGREARAAIDEARARVARLLGVTAREVVFTSGATESNNLALRGMVEDGSDTILVTSTIEHASILATCDVLADRGREVVRLEVDGDAQPDLERLRSVSSKSRCLLALGWANGETGHVLDLEAMLASVGEQTIVHLDAAQAAGRIPTALPARVELASISAHKMGGPRGVGALVVRDRARASLRAQLTGGTQEDGLRAGTENLAGIVGMGVAAELAASQLMTEMKRLAKLRERLWAGLHARIEHLLRLSPSNGLPGTLSVAVSDLDADVLVAALDLAGFCVSTGSACAAASPEPSHVIEALKVPSRYRRGAARISMGPGSDTSGVDALIAAFADAVSRARLAA